MGDPRQKMLHRAVLTLLVCSVVAFPTPQELAQVSGTAPDTFLAEFDASALQGGAKGKITVEVHKDWAPKGADRFFQLVQSGFFKNAGVFRVVPNFVVQFGINADPQIQANYRGAAANIQDDPVKQSNKKGTIVFATSGPNTRTTQLFINLNDNTNLDTMGFSPFGRVVKGMENVQKIYAGLRAAGPEHDPDPGQRLPQEGLPPDDLLRQRQDRPDRCRQSGRGSWRIWATGTGRAAVAQLSSRCTRTCESKK